MKKATKRSSAKNTKPAMKDRIFIGSTIAFILIALALIVVGYLIPRQINATRKAEIIAVFDSIKLSDAYVFQQEDVFGEKRTYDWDTSRSSSSSRAYIRAANVDVVAKDLRKKIIDAGYTEIDHPYPHQWQYKSTSGTYVRFDALSKPRSDCFFNQSQMKQSTNSCPGLNEGPTSVTLKVNLDDNNE